MVSLLECQGLRMRSENVTCVLTFGNHLKVTRPTQTSDGRCFFNQQFIFPFRPNSELKAVIMRDRTHGGSNRVGGGGNRSQHGDDESASSVQLSPRDFAIDVVFSDSPRINVPVADWFDLASVGEIIGATQPAEDPVHCGRLHVALGVFNTMFLKSIISQIGGTGSDEVSLGTAGSRSNRTAATPRGGSRVLLRAWELLAKRQASRDGGVQSPGHAADSGTESRDSRTARPHGKGRPLSASGGKQQDTSSTTHDTGLDEGEPAEEPTSDL